MPYADLARPEPSADRWRIALGLREAFAARATNYRRCRRMWGRQYSRPAPAIGGGAYSGRPGRIAGAPDHQVKAETVVVCPRLTASRRGLLMLQRLLRVSGNPCWWR